MGFIVGRWLSDPLTPIKVTPLVRFFLEEFAEFFFEGFGAVVFALVLDVVGSGFEIELADGEGASDRPVAVKAGEDVSVMIQGYIMKAFINGKRITKV